MNDEHKHHDCCDDGHAGPALKLAEARERILAEAHPVRGAEMLAVRSALGRVLGADVVSRRNRLIRRGPAGAFSIGRSVRPFWSM